MCKICRNESLDNIITLDCNNCTKITEIPEINNSKITQLSCCNCPNLRYINTIKGLKFIFCTNSPKLIGINSNNKLLRIDSNLRYRETIYISTPRICNIMYIPNVKYTKIAFDNDQLIYSNDKYHYHEKLHKLITNIYNLWKRYKLYKYINYLQQYIYSNPRLPYIQYYIENNIDELQISNTPKKITNIGYINSKNKLIWYTIQKNI